MLSCSTLVVASALLAAVHALPVDDISARNGIGSATSGVGGQAAGGSVTTTANSCTGPAATCVMAEILNASLVKVASENAGNGGNAVSGAANGKALLGLVPTNSTRKVPEGSGFSGAGGEAPGGSVMNSHPALIELDSDNAGQGGNASSGNGSGLVN